MPKVSVANMPLHPVLNDMPSALTPASLAFDVLGTISGNRRFHDAARYALAGSLISSVPAAVAGVVDYMDIPKGTSTRHTANVHAMLNAGLMALTAVNLATRRDAGRTNPVSMGLSILANAGLMISGWYGNRLVYEHGFRVSTQGDMASSAERAGSVVMRAGSPTPAGDIAEQARRARDAMAEAVRSAEPAGAR